MTTRRRGILLRTGVIAALALAGTVVFASPASAEAQIGQVNSPTLNVGGGQVNLNVTINNTGAAPSTATTVTITVPVSADLNIAVGTPPSGCSKSSNIVTCQVGAIPGNESRLLAIPLSPPASSNLPANGTADDTGEVALSQPAQTKTFKVTLKQASATGVPSVSGTVRDINTGDPIDGAAVVVVDSAQKSVTVTSGADGKFTANGPFAAGTINIAAGKTGFANQTREITGRAGQPVANVQFSLKATGAASASAVPEDTALPSTDASGGTPAAAGPEGSGESGTSMLSWVLIGLGGLLVLLGIGAIVLLLVRRRDDRDEDGEPDDDPRAPVRRAPVPVGRPAGGYRGGADPTMVARGAPMGGMDDATAIVRSPRAPMDDYTDPYGAPRPSYPTSPGPAGYGRPTSSGPAGYGRPAGDPGYAPPDPSYGGGYRGGGTPGYGANGSAHPSSGAGYGDPGYGSARPSTGGGYGAGEPGGGVYGAEESRSRYGLGGGAEPPPRRHGADEPTGRFSPGAPPRPAGGYGDQGGGYGGDPGYGAPRGYDDRGGYEQPPPPPRGGTPPPPARGGRRPVEWLDD